MKKILLLSLVSLFVFNTNAQQNDEQLKSALNIFFTYKIIFQNSHHTIDSVQFTYNNNKKEGFKFLSAGNNKYSQYNFIREQDSIIGISDHNGAKYMFTRNKNRINKITINSNTYRIEYEQNKPIKFILNKLKFGYYKYVYEIEYSDIKPTKITYYENNLAKKTTWYRRIRTFEYEKNKICNQDIYYKTDFPNKAENISNKDKVCFERINKVTYKFTYDWKVLTKRYDIKNKLVFLKDSSLNYNTYSETRFFYYNSKLYKKEIKRFKYNKLTEKEIKIIFVNPALTDNVPEYEKEIGRYKFNNKGEMIYESKNGLWREKENGKWSKWKHFVF